MNRHSVPSGDENMAQCEALLRHVIGLFDKHTLAGEHQELMLDMEHMMYVLAGTVGYIAVELSSAPSQVMLDFIHVMLGAANKRQAELDERANAQ